MGVRVGGLGGAEAALPPAALAEAGPERARTWAAAGTREARAMPRAKSPRAFAAFGHRRGETPIACPAPAFCARWR